MKSKKLDDTLFASYSSETDSSESESESESSSESCISSSSSEEEIGVEEASTAASICNNQNRRPMKKVTLNKTSSIQLSDDSITERRFGESEDNLSTQMLTTLEIKLKHMVLKKGASKGICLTPYSVTNIIEEQRDLLINDIHQLQEKFINMIKIDPIKAKYILEKHYFKRL